MDLKTSRDGKCTSSLGSQALYITPTDFFPLIIAVPMGLMKLSTQQQYSLNFVSPGFYALSFLYLRILLSFWPET